MFNEFFYKFGKLIYKIDYFYAEVAKKSGVKPNLMWILYALNDGKSHSQKEISVSWDIPITTINSPRILSMVKRTIGTLSPINVHPMYTTKHRLTSRVKKETSCLIYFPKTLCRNPLRTIIR